MERIVDDSEKGPSGFPVKCLCLPLGRETSDALLWPGRRGAQSADGGYALICVAGA
jgi:hypothetical protein